MCIRDSNKVFCFFDNINAKVQKYTSPKSLDGDAADIENGSGATKDKKFSIGKACSLVRCTGCWFGNMDFAEKMEKAANAPINFGDKAKEIDKNPKMQWMQNHTGFPKAEQAIPGPESSYVTAVACGCLPAILKHLDTLRRIECTYVQCAYSAMSAGSPLGECGEMRRVQMCKFFVGPLFRLVPIGNFVESVSAWFTGRIRTAPQRMINMLLTEPLCRNYGAVNCKDAKFELGAVTLREVGCAVFKTGFIIDEIIRDTEHYKEGEYWFKLNTLTLADHPCEYKEVKAVLDAMKKKSESESSDSGTTTSTGVGGEV